MHPNKFLGRQAASVAPQMSEVEKLERLAELGELRAAKRKEAIDARKASGIEETWLACEEAYLGIDDANRHEFAKAAWAKPTSMSGGLTASGGKPSGNRSTAFVRLTSRYVDNAAAKMGEILFPIDDKAFSFEATPDPDLVKQAEDINTLMAHPDGAPMMRPLKDGEPPQQPGAQQVQVTAADMAQQAIEKASDCAKKAEMRLYDWMTEAKYPAEGRKIVHDAARIGVGVLKGPFPDFKESKAATKVGNKIALQIERKLIPSMCWVDPWNLFPGAACGEDIHSDEDIFERDFLTPKKLKALKKQPGYIASQINKVIEEGPNKVNLAGSNAADKTKDKRFEVWYNYCTLSRDEMALAGALGLDELPEDQEEVHAVVTLVNDTVIRAIINPLDSGSFPYRVMTWSRRPGHWAGVGVGEQITMPQRTVNAATRSLFNNAGISAGVQIILKRTGIVPADGSYEITPNKVWYSQEDVEDVRKAFNAIIIPSVQEQLMAIIQYGMKLAEESSGIPLVTQGQSGPTDPQTFGQAELQDNNAHTWLRSVGYRFDDQITEPLIDDLYEWLLLDTSVPDDEKGDFKINAHGSIAMVERVIQENTIMGLLQASANPAFKLDPSRLMALYLRAKRLDPREAQLSPEEQAERDKQPPPPPVQVMVEQVKGQNAMQQIQAKGQLEASLAQQEMAHEQQALQDGGTSPHQAAAMAKIEQEKIRAQTAQVVEASRAHAEQARADKEYEIAQQNGAYRIQELQLQREIAILEYTSKQNITIQQAQAQLAQTAIQEKTKRALGAAEVELAAHQGNADRAVDMHKHATSLVRDEISTPNTP